MPSTAFGPEGVIQWTELRDSPEEHYTAREGKATRTFLVAWPERWDFCRGMLDYTEVQYDAGGEPYLVRFFPEPYPEIGTVKAEGGQDDQDAVNVFHPWLYATSVESITGVGPRGWNEKTQAPIYEKARVTIGYESRSYRTGQQYKLQNGFLKTVQVNPFGQLLDSDPLNGYVTHYTMAEAESYQFPFGTMKFADGSNETINGVHGTRNKLDVFYVWHDVPARNFNFMAQMRHTCSFLGCVNGTGFGKGKAGTYGTGTLLMVGAQATAQTLVTGEPAYNLAFRMKYFDPETEATKQQVFDPLGGLGHNLFPKFVQPKVAGIPVGPASYNYRLLVSGTPVNYDYLLLPGYGQVVYPYRPFDELFRVMK